MTLYPVLRPAAHAYTILARFLLCLRQLIKVDDALELQPQARQVPVMGFCFGAIVCSRRLYTRRGIANFSQKYLALGAKYIVTGHSLGLCDYCRSQKIYP
jgi:hypothetical protein